ncbi:MAG: hypothetical protein E7529_00520 [Ruminococcaceae bacterium]|nr:hypothetical protein [Oscillospiraceae bacterium]
MFKILTFKQMAIISFFLCLIMLLGSFLNTLSPYVDVFSQNEEKIPIIMYHQISENKAIWGDYVIPLSVLEEDFQYMKNHNINPISFEQLSLYIEKGERLPQNPIIITFDDGERSFITKVLPLVEEYKYPVNMNLVGSLVELYTKNGDTDDRYAYLNEKDVKELAENKLVSLGCHSYNLHSLSGRRGMGKIYGESEEEYKTLIYKDIEKFNTDFKRITGRNTDIIAYPYGIKNDTLKAIVREKGFKITLTCREEINKLSVGADLEELGRFNRPYGKSSKSFFEKIYKE